MSAKDSQAMLTGTVRVLNILTAGDVLVGAAAGLAGIGAREGSESPGKVFLADGGLTDHRREVETRTPESVNAVPRSGDRSLGRQFKL